MPSFARALVVGVAGFLLLSMGGAIVAAPVTLPGLWCTTRSTPSRGVRIAAATVAALTAGELAWALTYAGVGEATPAIWVLPLAIALVTASLFGTRRTFGHRGDATR